MKETEFSGFKIPWMLDLLDFCSFISFRMSSWHFTYLVVLKMSSNLSLTFLASSSGLETRHCCSFVSVKQWNKNLPVWVFLMAEKYIVHQSFRNSQGVRNESIQIIVFIFVTFQLKYDKDGYTLLLLVLMMIKLTVPSGRILDMVPSIPLNSILDFNNLASIERDIIYLLFRSSENWSLTWPLDWVLVIFWS